jgi:hypothetical protein
MQVSRHLGHSASYRESPRPTGPEDELAGWGRVDWGQAEQNVRRPRQRIFATSQAGDLRVHSWLDRPRPPGSRAVSQRKVDLDGDDGPRGAAASSGSGERLTAALLGGDLVQRLVRG